MTSSADQYFAVIPESVLYSNISDRACRVYGVLRRHADKNDGTCHPGRKRIASLIHASTSSVDRALAELVGIGAVEVVHRRDPDNPKQLLSNQYRVLTPPVGDQTPPVGDETPLPSVKPPSPVGDEVTRVIEPKPVELESPNLDGSDASRLCELLADSIASRGAKRPTVSDAWLTDMDRLLRLDQRPPAQVERVIRWLRDGSDDVARFWQPNIRSPQKLRAKWDQMAEQYANQKQRRGSVHDGTARVVDDWAARAQRDEKVLSDYTESVLRFAGVAKSAAPEPQPMKELE